MLLELDKLRGSGPAIAKIQGWLCFCSLRETHDASPSVSLCLTVEGSGLGARVAVVFLITLYLSRFIFYALFFLLSGSSDHRIKNILSSNLLPGAICRGD